MLGRCGRSGCARCHSALRGLSHGTVDRSGFPVAAISADSLGIGELPGLLRVAQSLWKRSGRWRGHNFLLLVAKDKCSKVVTCRILEARVTGSGGQRRC
eukprot:symbB.v1.2.035430.t1/scaffold4748.1/size59687/5